MVKRSTPDEIVLDEIMQESLKQMGKGETATEPVTEQPAPEAPPLASPKPQFGFKLGEVKTPDSFVVQSKKEERKEVEKKQVILDKPSLSLDDDIIVEW